MSAARRTCRTSSIATRAARARAPASSAADLAVAAVGTETDGSIVCPSGANGVVGIKPTLGLWSRAGIVPISADQDTAGPMARNVTDAAVLLGAATGVDPDDDATADQVAFTRLHPVPRRRGARGARIGVWRDGTYNQELVGPVVEPMRREVEARAAALLRARLGDVEAEVERRANERAAQLYQARAFRLAKVHDAAMSGHEAGEQGKQAPPLEPPPGVLPWPARPRRRSPLHRLRGDV